MSSSRKFVSDVAYYLATQADWRRQKAAEFPDDPRNAEAAASLDRLAAYVERASGNCDVRERYLAAQIPVVGAGWGGDETRRYISRFGFTAEIQDGVLDACVDELCTLCAQDNFAALSDLRTQYDAASDYEVAGLARDYCLIKQDVRDALRGLPKSVGHFEVTYGSHLAMQRVLSLPVELGPVAGALSPGAAIEAIRAHDDLVTISYPVGGFADTDWKTVGGFANEVGVGTAGVFAFSEEKTIPLGGAMAYPASFVLDLTGARWVAVRHLNGLELTFDGPLSVRLLFWNSRGTTPTGDLAPGFGPMSIETYH